jgi:hypothetical protein
MGLHSKFKDSLGHVGRSWKEGSKETWKEWGGKGGRGKAILRLRHWALSKGNLHPETTAPRNLVSVTKSDSHRSSPSPDRFHSKEVKMLTTLAWGFFWQQDFTTWQLVRYSRKIVCAFGWIGGLVGKWTDDRF